MELSCVLPLQFERYAKILHRLDGHYENIDNPLSSEEIAILGLPDCSIVRELVIQKRRSSATSRIFWKEAANALGIPYAPQIKHRWFSIRLKPHTECWPRYIYGPAGGALEADECRELVSVLTMATGKQECYFRLAEMPFIATDQNLLFTGTLNEVEDFFVNGQFQFTPEYWWSHDHSWCVCTDYDLEFTLVGGTSALIEPLLENNVLECIEVPSNIRVDYLTPIP
ncbi:hypothetical protein [Occallatibacter savannae]|uniref:hypothetical protein n=1 Tax=Occallatibacter savannae TaxID=1002691 RepID=UPI0013A53EFC|nr:hypothetical protein [Occallatibacter savannae]